MNLHPSEVIRLLYQQSYHPLDPLAGALYLTGAKPPNQPVNVFATPK